MEVLEVQHVEVLLTAHVPLPMFVLVLRLGLALIVLLQCVMEKQVRYEIFTTIEHLFKHSFKQEMVLVEDHRKVLVPLQIPVPVPVIGMEPNVHYQYVMVNQVSTHLISLQKSHFMYNDEYLCFHNRH